MHLFMYIYDRTQVRVISTIAIFKISIYFLDYSRSFAVRAVGPGYCRISLLRICERHIHKHKNKQIVLD
jgi:hypothetical protein